MNSAILGKSETFLGIKFLSARKTISITKKMSYVEIHGNRESRGSPEPPWDVDWPRQPRAEGAIDTKVRAATKSFTSFSKRFLCQRGHGKCAFHLSMGWFILSANLSWALWNSLSPLSHSGRESRWTPEKTNQPQTNGNYIYFTGAIKIIMKCRR